MATHENGRKVEAVVEVEVEACEDTVNTWVLLQKLEEVGDVM